MLHSETSKHKYYQCTTTQAVSRNVLDGGYSVDQDMTETHDTNNSN
jgi:hypothetical protein